MVSPLIQLIPPENSSGRKLYDYAHFQEHLALQKQIQSITPIGAQGNVVIIGPAGTPVGSSIASISAGGLSVIGSIRATTSIACATLAATGVLAGASVVAPLVRSPLVAGGSGAASTLTLESTSGAGTSDAIILKTGSQVTALTVDSAQRVAIGTSTPSHFLDILQAGTATTAALRLASGARLTTAVPGVFEYDGTAQYFTPVNTNRGVVDVEHFLSLTGNQSGTNVATAQSWFPGGGATAISVPATTSYFFEGKLMISRNAGTASHTIAVLFGGSAGITSIQYSADVSQNVAGSTPSLAQTFLRTDASVATATVLTNNTSVAAEWFSGWIRGIVRISTAGTLIPQFQFSTAPGSIPTVQANTWFRMTAIGNNTVLSVGQWS
jgi:hypothetical protein